MKRKPRSTQAQPGFSVLCSTALLTSNCFSLENFKGIQSLELHCAQMPRGSENFTGGGLVDMELPATLQQRAASKGACAEPLRFFL